jgi:hypothetical protein
LWLKVRLFSYIVRYDFGFAPNPFCGWCTLATCKQDIRSHVQAGDWVIGTGSKPKGLAGYLVYAMEVEEVLTFGEYWDDPRFVRKRPNLSGSVKQRYGDNIYKRDADGQWRQLDSRHSLENGSPNPGHIARDTKADAVLASRRFVYWGGRGPLIPEKYRAWNGADICASRPGYKCNFPDDLARAFVEWATACAGEGYMSDPADW